MGRAKRNPSLRDAWLRAERLVGPTASPIVQTAITRHSVMGFASLYSSYGAARAVRAASAATAGSVLPSRNSRNAPPPVEMYETSSAMPYLSTAARVSPPPAMEKAFAAAMARARVSVPLPKASNPNTPTGHFPPPVPAYTQNPPQ